MIHGNDVYVDIKSRLVKKGIKIKDIAAMAGVSPTTVSVVLTGRWPSKNVQETIAKALGVKFSDLWPDIKRKKAA